MIEIEPETKIVRFVRSTDSGNNGYVERATGLADLRVGWTLSVKTRHASDREVAEVVKVVHEP